MSEDQAQESGVDVATTLLVDALKRGRDGYAPHEHNVKAAMQALVHECVAKSTEALLGVTQEVIKGSDAIKGASEYLVQMTAREYYAREEETRVLRWKYDRLLVLMGQTMSCLSPDDADLMRTTMMRLLDGPVDVAPAPSEEAA